MDAHGISRRTPSGRFGFVCPSLTRRDDQIDTITAGGRSGPKTVEIKETLGNVH